MADSDTIYVEPTARGWRWRKGLTSKAEQSKVFEGRKEAIEDAYLERENEAIILLRLDGTVCGELYHASPAGSVEPTRAQVLAGMTREEAG